MRCTCAVYKGFFKWTSRCTTSNFGLGAHKIFHYFIGSLRSPYDSSTKALDSLQWKSLDFRRKFHRCATIYKSTISDISYTFSNKTGKDLHNIQTRNNELYHLPKVKTNWGKQVSSYLFIDDWNKLDTSIKSAGNFNIFKQRFWKL